MKNQTLLFQKASERAYGFIYGRILDGGFKPGMKLVLRKVAALSGVSVIPVIEALNRLEEDGLVESRAHWGYFVAMPTRQQTRNQLILREAVECQVARLLSQTLGSTDKKRLKNAARRLDRMFASHAQSATDGEREIERAHYEFHLLMAQMTGFEVLVETLQRINLFFLLLKANAVANRPHVRMDWHERLASGITEGTVEQAEAVMRMHVRDSYETIINGVPEIS